MSKTAPLSGDLTASEDPAKGLGTPFEWDGEGGLPPLPSAVLPPEDPAPAKLNGKPVPGYTFILSEGDAKPIWGRNREILWVEGEPLLICAPTGAGKTTIAQQVANALMQGGNVLGYPVQKIRGRVLYVAADRPRQAARSWKRMVDPSDNILLNAQLRVVTEARIEQLTRLAEEAEAEVIFIDTLGAVASNVHTDEGGQRVYEELQKLVAAGLQVCILHHTRKKGEGKRDIDDVYGSQWLGAVMGSVLLVEKQNRSGTKGFIRLEKQPDEPVYLRIYHDHLNGHTQAEKWEPSDDDD